MIIQVVKQRSKASLEQDRVESGGKWGLSVNIYTVLLWICCRYEDIQYYYGGILALDANHTHTPT